jgi:hypothetical protein
LPTGAVLKKILFIITPLAIAISVIYAFSDSRNGYLNKNVTNGNVTVYFGTEIAGGRAHLWTDKQSGTLYADTDRKIDDGFAKDVSSLTLTGKKVNGLFETVVSLSPEEEDISETLPDSIREPGKKYYELCSTCHAAAEPGRYDKHRWDSILQSMQQHGGISDSDLSVIQRYILLSITD